MDERSFGAGVTASVFGGLGIGVGVGVVVGIVGTAISAGECLPEEECLAVLSGMAYGLIAGVIAAAIAVIVLAVRLRVGGIFGVGVAVAMGLLVGAVWVAMLGQARLLVFLAGVVLVVACVLNSSQRRQWARPSRGSLLVAAGFLVLAGLPAGWMLGDVWSEQQRIEEVVERPLQTDLDGTWPYSVEYSSTGIDYLVFEPPSNGSRIAEVEVSIRNLAPDQAPCTGFTDVTGGPVTQCSEVEPGLWQARGPEGESRYFVHADERQWAYVRAGTYGGGDAQRRHDARAEQIARDLEPRSAWPLAADSVGCGFCEWLT
ncbi:hypothetical protein AB0H36_26695 [Kribbella sp. NPDC050820]|uniref:hypothetical protein n=1 Tax=Kribbella sp. NPDC050820 TaxID=3155408 RepID=UPI0034115311